MLLSVQHKITEEGGRYLHRVTCFNLSFYVRHHLRVELNYHVRKLVFSTTFES